jgi:hypothetical protein
VIAFKGFPFTRSGEGWSSGAAYCLTDGSDTMGCNPRKRIVTIAAFKRASTDGFQSTR